MNNTGDGGNALEQFPKGTPVYDASGEKVGTVAEADPQHNGLIIQKGLFFRKDIPVPISAIARSDSEGIYLNVSKDDASNGIWGTARDANATNVDTQTPYRADAARSVGDRDSDVAGSGANDTAFPPNQPFEDSSLPSIDQQRMDQ